VKARKKPVVIECFQLGVDDIPDWFMDRVSTNQNVLHNIDMDLRTGSASITTLEGTMRADFGDYVIQGVKGEQYPCKADIFEATYEKVPE